MAAAAVSRKSVQQRMSATVVKDTANLDPEGQEMGVVHGWIPLA